MSMKAGDKVVPRKLTTIDGVEQKIPAEHGLVHLQFRRFAGCPICSLHMREVGRRHTEIAAAGVTEIVLFHSSASALRRYQADLPFAVVADPDRRLYAEFGVENSVQGMLTREVARAVARGVREIRSVREVVGAIAPTENHLGMPADFLIGPDGVIRACKYGTHADDQWSVDELLHLASA